MNRIFTILIQMAAGILLTAGVFAQVPEKMSYQAVLRGVTNELIINQEVGMQISILQGSASGTAVYVETQTPTTNGNGLVTIEIGTGTTSDDFSAIDWTSGPYFIKTETDPEGGSTYSITGTSQLLSVPYALHSGTSDVLTGEITESQISDLGTYIETETDPSVPSGTQTGEMQYWNGSVWVTVAAGHDGATLTFKNGVPIWVTSPIPVTNPTTGEIWMDRNLGASQAATSSTDAAAYGDLYQWGRATDGHEIRTSGTTSTLSDSDIPGHDDFILAPFGPDDWRSPQNDNLWQGVNGTNNPCPSGYRLPTEAEWEAERASWSRNDATGAFTSPLRLPVAGYRRSGHGDLGSVGSTGLYWSSSVGGTSSRYLDFSPSDALMRSNYRAYGTSVRCIKD